MRRLDLPENLRFPDDLAFERRRNPEKMAKSRLVAEPVDRLFNRPIAAGSLDQDLARRVGGCLGIVAGNVKLDPIARRDDKDSLRAASSQTRDRLADFVVSNEQVVTQADRPGAMTYAGDNQVGLAVKRAGHSYR